ncbi:MAG TPA: DUF4010 domain-containing protein [Verrucomicrobiae bacterium]|nr:DUF4010 domain-containing protein [Verrucomicrobiae bacterium]
MTPDGVARLGLLLGLAFFFGFAFEGFFAGATPRRPGGVRTFPLLALAGGGLYLLEPHHALAFIAGLLVVGAWVFAYLSRQLAAPLDPDDGPFIVPACNVLAYVLGAVALTQPLWLSVTITVAAVLLLGGRRRLHDWVRRLPGAEVVTAAQFLILVGIVLPLLYGRPAIPHTAITPFGVWLAVVAVSTISYASYLLQTYVFPRSGTILMAMLGGLYSSTAATVVLARRARDEGMTPEIGAGIVAASAMMYLRILVVCVAFSLSLGELLAPPLLGLCAICLALVWIVARTAPRSKTPAAERIENPLQLSTALVFAGAFLVISLVTSAVQAHLGRAGVLGLAAVVGVTDVDPFVLSLAQGIGNVGTLTAAVAIVIATSSNNVLKALYTLAFARRRASLVPAGLLGATAAIGLGFAALMLR